MRLGMHRWQGALRPCVVVTGGSGELVVDIASSFDALGVEAEAPAGLPGVLSDWARLSGIVHELCDRVLSGDETVASAVSPAREAALAAPIGAGQLIVCCGFNYAAHEQEVRGDDGGDGGPSWFIKNANAVIGPEAPILLPPDNGDTVDFEGELAVVIGKRCHRVGADEALDYVGGYTLINDVSARLYPPPIGQSTDAIKRSVIDSHLGKQYPTFCPIGPTVVTADEVVLPSSLSFTTFVNGEVRQQAKLRDMRLGVPELIEWLSGIFVFEPGDIVSTGSPAGSGISQNPPAFLQNGDVVTITADQIGELNNPVASHGTR